MPKLLQDKAEYLYDGKCDYSQPVTIPEPVVSCSTEYVPVCGIKDGKRSSYSNKCKLLQDKAEYLYDGKCDYSQPVTIPEPVVSCTSEYVPVCGIKDGKRSSYSNKCKLWHKIKTSGVNLK